MIKLTLQRGDNMKFCNKCGAQIEDDCKFCPKCGADQSDNFDVAGTGNNSDKNPNVNGSQNSSQQPQYGDNYNTPVDINNRKSISGQIQNSQNSSNPPKKSKKVPIIITVAACVSALGAAAAALIIFHPFKGSADVGTSLPPTTAEHTTAVETTQPATEAPTTTPLDLSGHEAFAFSVSFKDAFSAYNDLAGSSDIALYWYDYNSLDYYLFTPTDTDLKRYEYEYGDSQACFYVDDDDIMVFEYEIDNLNKLKGDNKETLTMSVPSLWLAAMNDITYDDAEKIYSEIYDRVKGGSKTAYVDGYSAYGVKDGDDLTVYIVHSGEKFIEYNDMRNMLRKQMYSSYYDDSRENNSSGSEENTYMGETIHTTNGYILPQSNTQRLTESDIASLSKTEIMLARNEIYARRGREFDTDSIEDYFERQSWYHGYIDPEDFTESMLNSTEKYNVEFLKKYG